MPDVGRDFLRNLVSSCCSLLKEVLNLLILFSVLLGNPTKRFSITAYRKHCRGTRPLPTHTRHKVDVSLNRAMAYISRWLLVSERGSEPQVVFPHQHQRHCYCRPRQNPTIKPKSMLPMLLASEGWLVAASKMRSGRMEGQRRLGTTDL